MNRAVSIIVPVYKSENKLPQCVDRILHQTFQDFELILIDDGSPDHCGTICDQYAAKDSRVQVIHQSNQGAAAARNAGLDVALGDYIAFCDSDDLVSPQWLEHLVSYAQPDALPMCSYCLVSDHLGQSNPLRILAGQSYPTENYWQFSRCGIAGFLWNALYCRQVIQDHHLRLRTQHEKGDYNEDLLFALTYVGYIKKIVYTGYCDYLYCTHEGSLSHSYPEMYFEKYEEKYHLWNAFLKGCPESQAELCSIMLYHFLQAMDHCKLSKFKTIVTSACLQDCVRKGDTSKENPTVISLIKKKAVLNLWIRYQLHHLKGRFL